MTSLRARRLRAALTLGVTMLCGAFAPTLAPAAAVGLHAPAFTQAVDPALVDPGAPVSLHVTKYLGSSATTSNDGQPMGSPPSLPTLKGVTFDVYRVYTDPGRSQRLDLTTNAGWATAAAISAYRATPADFAAEQFTVSGTTYHIGTPLKSITTDGSGVATFTEPSGAGLYLVRENLAPGDKITANPGGDVPPDQITPAAPFFVTLPMTDPSSRSAWMYDVYVYPKNQQSRVSLKVIDKGTSTTQGGHTYGAAADHTYDYELTTSVTPGPSGVGTYVLYNPLPPTATLDAVAVSLDGIPMVAGTDYDVFTAAGWSGAATAFTSGTTPPVSGGPVVVVVMKAAGLAKLDNAGGQNVVTTYSVTAAPRPSDGLVTDRASLVPSSGWWDANGQAGIDPATPATAMPASFVGVRSNAVDTTFGDVAVTKTDASSPAPLAGAIFDVLTDANGNGTCEPSEVTAANVIGTTTATDGAGKTAFSGLQTSNYANGAGQAAAAYCLVEKTAPSGYELLAAPVAFTISKAAPGTLARTDVTVQNQKSDLVNKLPLTGGSGPALLSAIGIALILAGIGYYVVSSRRARSRRGTQVGPTGRD